MGGDTGGCSPMQKMMFPRFSGEHP
jgi:hypothetical protein